MAEIPVLDANAVLAAVSPAEAIERTRLAFERHAVGEWAMPPKVYLDSPPNGDFRAMPARGDGFALLKWVTSFPAQLRARPAGRHRGAAALRRRDRRAAGDHGLRLDHLASHRRRGRGLRAGPGADGGASSVGLIGCGVNGAWAARCLAAAGYGPGVCADPRAERAEALAAELGWARRAIAREAAAQDVVVTVTPGAEPVILASDLRPGQHLAVLGADASGKAEVELAALERCRLFCDEWEQARRAASWPARSRPAW